MHSLTRLNHILAVARTGSFSLAAEEVHISQPALSRSNQAFEEEYDLRLFDRGRGGVTLTRAGKLAVEHARQLIASAKDFDRDMRRFGWGEAGQTGVGMGPLMASLLLPKLGAAMLRRNPHLTVLTRTGSPDRMLDALLEGTIELIVGNVWQLSLVPGVTEEHLGVLPLAIAVRRGHPLTERTALLQRDLDAYPSARSFDHQTGSTANSAGAFVSDNFNILRDVVLETDCTWLVTPALIRGELHRGDLVQLEISDLAIVETRTSLIYLRERTRSPASLTIAETIRATVQELSAR
ncbi:LysR family transcriptional regulator [Novosphingobium sp. M1R2S20]|uniref:LysR family transcriptional regulator n=1 Tax=Novosphingobium rhizovicinum TaxID=3228928 RepID=A0ABV3RE61_9SPHN